MIIWIIFDIQVWLIFINHLKILYIYSTFFCNLNWKFYTDQIDSIKMLISRYYKIKKTKSVTTNQIDNPIVDQPTTILNISSFKLKNLDVYHQPNKKKHENNKNHSFHPFAFTCLYTITKSRAVASIFGTCIDKGTGNDPSVVLDVTLRIIMESCSWLIMTEHDFSIWKSRTKGAACQKWLNLIKHEKS